jgi:hypothetical protein
MLIEKKNSITWAKVKVTVEKENEVGDFYLLGSYPLVGRHVVNEPKVGCHVVDKLEIS